MDGAERAVFADRETMRSSRLRGYHRWCRPAGKKCDGEIGVVNPGEAATYIDLIFVVVNHVVVAIVDLQLGTVRHKYTYGKTYCCV